MTTEPASNLSFSTLEKSKKRVKTLSIITLSSISLFLFYLGYIYLRAYFDIFDSVNKVDSYFTIIISIIAWLSLLVFLVAIVPTIIYWMVHLSLKNDPKISNLTNKQSKINNLRRAKNLISMSLIMTISSIALIYLTSQDAGLFAGLSILIFGPFIVIGLILLAMGYSNYSSNNRK